MGGGDGLKNGEGRMNHGGYWNHSEQWPSERCEKTDWFLHNNGQLNKFESEVESKISYRFDPLNPVHSLGGCITSGAPVMQGGAFNQVDDERFIGCQLPGKPLAARVDVLCFETEVLQEETIIDGPVVAKLWVSSDQPDTDITVKLVDVYPGNKDFPQGFSMNITDSILRLRYRDSWEEPTLLTQGEVYPIEIPLPPTANCFAKGHKIRIEISSSKFPHFDVNPNSGEPEGQGNMPRVAINTLFVGHNYPSRIECWIKPKR